MYFAGKATPDVSQRYRASLTLEAKCVQPCSSMSSDVGHPPPRIFYWIGLSKELLVEAEKHDEKDLAGPEPGNSGLMV